MADSAIETVDLTKRYGSPILAVDRLTLQVRRGEVYGFVGPNGSGKTTTMRMLVGLARPTSGSAAVLGAKAGSPDGLAHVGALIETPAFYPFLSGRDNLRFLAGHAGIASGSVDATLEQVGLTSRASDRFRTYSLGMKQRLGVAAALLKDPLLLILDEPMNGLDPAGTADMRALIRTFAREGRTVLLSSHMMSEVEQVCDRVGIIRKGRLIAEGTIDELRTRPHLLIRAEPRDKAQRVLSDAPGVHHVELVERGVRVDVDPASAPAIVRVLVRADIDVEELRVERASLEEVFLALTEKGEPS